MELKKGGWDANSYNWHINRKQYAFTVLPASFVWSLCYVYHSGIPPLPFSIIVVVVSVGRCHDLGARGWWCVLLAVPALNVVMRQCCFSAKETLCHNFWK